MIVNFGIDCDPYQQRPNVYAEAVFEKVGIEPVEPECKLFGAWSWSLLIVNSKLNADELSDWIKEYMTGLYVSDKIRGTEWNVLD